MNSFRRRTLRDHHNDHNHSMNNYSTIVMILLLLFIVQDRITLTHGQQQYHHHLDQMHKTSLRRQQQKQQKQQRQKNKEIKTPKPQRIVLIAGPHKTGSSSIQNNMYKWTTIPNAQNKLLLPQWSWPSPTQIYDDCNSSGGNGNNDGQDSSKKHKKKHEKEHMHGKIFYPFAEALHNCRIAKFRTIYDMYSCQELIDVYKAEFQIQWDAGYNLIIGTEAFDLIGHIPSIASAKNKDMLYMDDVLHQLPKNTTKEDITIVIKYRSPRTKHLISWYHECCMNTMTFRKFLQSEMYDHPDRGSRIIDSLYLVQKLLLEGYHVVLFDLSGVLDKGYDISNLIACDVLDAKCTPNKEIVGELEPPKISNVKQQSKNQFGIFEEEDMKKIERIIRQRDCKFRKFLEGPYGSLLKVMYAKDYVTTMDWCKRQDEDGLTRKEMNEAIKEVLKNMEGIEEDE